MLLVSLLLALWALPVVNAAPWSKVVERAPAAKYWWSWWSDGGLKVKERNLEDGKFDVVWSGTKGDFVGGKGWNPGGPK